ncbi:polyprenyl synthetase family protein [Fluviicola taffensis]|uniref:Trans-hexaprenyltranstransferase n=1 Tax=Fluviicola taffensis (strain DSM 16823 / NCIMB 13979 / RW262) TaxID=755732 RepID=F2ICM5_FLUTR|nr:polyprenyl synthetase family protein [Fluviicola taffensis]AEA42252.1 Trans-hexaprenyltranstransferase [Fluviicola taffensis DSM 16823]
MTVQEILAPIETEMKLFEVRFHESMKSKVPLLDKITHYIIRRKGKQMRPMFLFLTAKMLGEVNEKTYQSASLVELLHTATLVHDDVVDDANERRGFFSVNALWKNKIAVLVGDYMLSRVLLHSLENDNIRALQIVARAVREMSEGELLQIEKARKLDITEEVYFDVIRQKTASLIATVCESAAASVDREDMADRMRNFGELVGLAFQVKDDIFDYGTPGNIGKPTGNDIRERKMTLPLIYAMQHSDISVKKELLNIVKNHNEEKKYVQRAIQLVIEAGGIEYAHNRMIELKTEALSLLNDIPDSESKRALIGLVEYTVTRDK